MAKEALKIGAAVVDIEAADGVTSAVKGAGVAKRVEVFFIDDVADWGPFAEFLLIGHGAIVVDFYLFVQHDILHQLGIGRCILSYSLSCAVDDGCKFF